jgi:hypothetical protein
MASEMFKPRNVVKVEVMEGLIKAKQKIEVDFTTDEGYDDGGHVKET